MLPGWNNAENFFIETPFQILKSGAEGIRTPDVLRAREIQDPP